MVQGPRHFKRSPRSTHTKATVMFDYLVTAASAAAAYPNPPSNARYAASNCTELPGRMPVRCAIIGFIAQPFVAFR